MYKNFTLTESEREQILKQHKQHGYKKPLNEQNDSNDETPNLDKLEVEDRIYVPVESFTVYVLFHEDYDEVPVRVSRDEEGNPVFDVDDIMLPEGGNSEMFINAIKQKMGDNPFTSLKYNGAVLNYETGETENY